MAVRALGAALCLTAFGLATASCADPPPLSRVHVTITNLHETFGHDVTDADSGAIDIIFPGTNGDAGSVRRAIFWDLSDTFEFDVQIPPGTYGPPHFEATYYLMCPGRLVNLLSAQGEASTGFTVMPHAARTDAPPMRAVAVPSSCPP